MNSYVFLVLFRSAIKLKLTFSASGTYSIHPSICIGRGFKINRKTIPSSVVIESFNTISAAGGFCVITA